MTTPVLRPVWPHYFADPFVLRCGDDYFAYGTGEKLERTPDGAAAFPVLRSRDLLTWEPLGCALSVSPAHATEAYWAPEVAAARGEFCLYYSRAPAGEDEKHRLYVAKSAAPAGPFREMRQLLPDEIGFSIDAHPFRDPRGGRWYLFFACDYFDARTGTGIAVVPLHESMDRVDGAPVSVVRANHDCKSTSAIARSTGGCGRLGTPWKGPRWWSGTDATIAFTRAEIGRRRTTASALRWPSIRSGRGSTR